MAGLPGIGHGTAIRDTYKWDMREASSKAGCRPPRYALASTADKALAAARDMGLPVIIKPTDNQASRGVTKMLDRRPIWRRPSARSRRRDPVAPSSKNSARR
jgi:biotin carboxylase